MERWRDTLRTSSQSIVKTPRRSQSITSWPIEDDLQTTSAGIPMSDSSSTDHKRTASIDIGPSCSPAANRTQDLSSTVHLNSLENGSPAYSNLATSVTKR
ncbi:hypothetical protein PGT21_028273 [Puccinia graminis f. sp. tritici]|uniref:Uncharacterized protein n=1 Tax=Puccinia graminis f. sp. tritici TaxID=56615 RepID=A0A5B0MYX0_PUCGR|nr:hypothetical protein PGTUg99_006229 [Puccinia graminis f. sp. tritici]KAA1080317.1 hypothetical protein PGT21_002137 [Puccinia graminis f. sp. tritici]KAA1081050.1 hypothetical protein PGT21_028273 [Puccinia graminis f. sp. tritici]KAA1131210.1 hypothetical protein PGTUg99_024169 [Puccinia graminis f. sp. tritici]